MTLTGANGVLRFVHCIEALYKYVCTSREWGFWSSGSVEVDHLIIHNFLTLKIVNPLLNSPNMSHPFLSRGLGKFAPVLIGLLSGLAEVERSLTRERTIESIQHRKETGGNLGGSPKTSNAKEGLVLRLRNEGCSYRSIRKQTGLALSTIRRIIVEQEAMAV